LTIAYNSAYVQTETLNFNFAWQAVIVYFDADMSALTIRKFYCQITCDDTASIRWYLVVCYEMHIIV